VIEHVVNTQLATFLRSHPEEAEAISRRVLAARDARRTANAR
jgi:hypothetical protein